LKKRGKSYLEKYVVTLVLLVIVTRIRGIYNHAERRSCYSNNLTGRVGECVTKFCWRM